ncbi:MAG: LLM class flavin-dependent oxidoreductase [Gammaproteobacteria bacterium]|nr:LLM class flavin-dependent oxidoreductase [Gammaproteobacteria bacterium]
MSRVRFGAFLAPHHPIGEHPTLQLKRDLDLVEHLDRLGYDEFWCGEHHSTGWEVIASPEMFLAAAGQRTHTIKLGTGVVSLPYHHPFNVAQRMVQLDHMTGGRAIFGTGPGALPTDAFMLGIDPMTQRDRQDEAMGVIERLLAGERFSHESEWFKLEDAGLQLLPVQDKMPMAVASMISPSGMTLAGKYGCGVLSLGSMSTTGLAALPTQWSFAEESAARYGKTVDRRDWRVVMSFHVAETREQARAEAGHGLMRWHNEYIVGTLQRPGEKPYATPEDALDNIASMDLGGVALVGTPDDLIASIRNLQEVTGGFGTVLGFAHDWARPADTMKSWDLVARYVIPEVNGLLEPYRASQRYVIAHKEMLDRAGEAVMQKIMENDRAAAALKEPQGKAAMSSHNAPDLSKYGENKSAG